MFIKFMKNIIEKFYVGKQLNWCNKCQKCLNAKIISPSIDYLLSSIWGTASEHLNGNDIENSPANKKRDSMKFF